jgi:hypothetical protein
MSEFLGVSEYQPNHPDLLRNIIRVIRGIMQGKTNNTGTVTLTANATTTTITFAAGRLGQGTVILLSPTTANAAAALTNVYVSSRNVASNTLTLTHSNTATLDRTFSYVLIG